MSEPVKLKTLIYNEVKEMLVSRGWGCNPMVVASSFDGTKQEFIHPEENYRCTWVEALQAERRREVK